MTGIVDTIYDAATEAGRWYSVLRMICDAFGAFGGHLVDMDMNDGALSDGAANPLQLIHGFDYSRAELEALMIRFAALRHDDPRVQAALRYPGKPLSCRLVIPEAELHRSRVYREFLQPMNIEYTLFVQLIDQRDHLTGLALFRRPEETPWSQEDCDRLGVLIPHLRRGAGLLRRMAELDHRTRLSHAVLDAINAGIAFCRPDGTLEFLNRGARALIDCADGIATQNHKLVLWRSIDQAILERSLAATAVSGQHTAFAIQRPSSAKPYHCMISLALPGPSLDHAGPMLAIYVTDPDAAIETSGELLGQLYGLTPMESRVAEQITRGRSTAETALDLAIGRSTVRSHLKAIFAKANVHNQGEFARQVLANPFWTDSARDF